MDTIKDFKIALLEAESILILPHINPDGDTISSSLAIAMIIEKYFEREVELAVLGKVPAVYKFLPEVNKFKNYNEIDRNKKYDLVIAVDVASKDRLNEAVNTFNSAVKTINIDHHRTNNNYADINIVDAEACSAGQVVFDMVEEMELTITKDLATCLYTSILTDTGGFKYENTSIKTLETAAKLVSFGVNPCELYRACYESKPQSMVQFQAYAVNNANFTKEGKIAYTLITKEGMNKFGALDEHTDGISEALRQIKTVEVSMVLKENTEGHTKVSLRSKNIDISKIAETFNGGGHKFAAGCTIRKPIKIALNKLLEKLEEIIK